jgi:hypothetical protein
MTRGKCFGVDFLSGGDGWVWWVVIFEVKGNRVFGGWSPSLLSPSLRSMMMGKMC